MDFMTGMKIGAAGLDVQRQRIEAISSNLANMETTRTAEGGPYRRKDVVVTALPMQNEFGDALKTALGDQLNQAAVTDVVEDQKTPKMVYNPEHPDANELGYVAMPNINLMDEMVNLMTASRTFEANITAINATKSMAQRSIDLAR